MLLVTATENARRRVLIKRSNNAASTLPNISRLSMIIWRSSGKRTMLVQQVGLQQALMACLQIDEMMAKKIVLQFTSNQIRGA
jgi:hypothetical protein